MLDVATNWIYKTFLPKNIHTEEFVERTKVRFFVVSVCVFLLATFIVTLIWLLINDWFITQIESAIIGCSVIIQLSSLLYFHYRGHLSFVAKNLIWSHYFLLLMMVVGSGGIYSPFLIAFIFMQVFSGFLINAKHCKTMLLTNLAVMLILSVSDQLSYELPNRFIRHPENLSTIFHIIGLLLIVAVFASYEFTLKALKDSIVNEKERFLADVEYEPLTGMISYRAFENMVDSNIGQKKPFAIIYIDLLDFKEVNNVYGHAVGDKVLQQIAARISNVVPNTDIVTRVQSDEFSVLVQSVDEEAAYKDMMDKIKQAVEMPINIDVDKIQVSCQLAYCATTAGNDSKASLLMNVKSQLSS